MSHLSVIIPTYNRAGWLTLTLQSLARQEAPPQFEVIVADNGSTDNTAEVVKGFPDVRYIHEPAPGRHIAIHVALSQARGEIIVSFDDDVEVFPTHLSTVALAFEEPQIALVGGKCLPRFDVARYADNATRTPSWFTKQWQPNANGERMLPYLSLIDLGELPRFIDPQLVFGCNFSIRRIVLEEAGGFHPDTMPQAFLRYRGDGETWVSRYVQASGYRAYYHPAASVHHYVPRERLTFKYIYGRGYAQGISDSFTEIRTAHGMDGKVNAVAYLSAMRRSEFPALPSKPNLLTAIRRSLGRVKRYLLTDEFDRAVVTGHAAGFAWHQQNVRESPALLQWVLRPNYWDARV